MRAELRPLAGGLWKPDPDWQAQMEAVYGDEWRGDRPSALRKGLLAALVSRDLLLGEERPRWHISLQHRDRVPTWEEMAATAHELRPGVPFAIGVPPKSWWINVHPNVLHLWEIRDQALLEQWQAERRGDRPT